VIPEVERAINEAWNAAAARLGQKLFDGPMCRLERWSASPERLDLTLSRSSYRPFLGTNLYNARLADIYGVDVLANPVGLSTALQTSDGYLLLGRRNDSVAYYPNRVHPFAGALEPHEPLNVFEDIRRELREELHLDVADIEAIRCVGLVEDRSLRQPELIFIASTARTKGELERQLDRTEHIAVYAVQADRSAVEHAMRDLLLTPVAVASLALWLERS
jgi:8-oxo-dGTP pyrophosphatase MutT (NUDIX family)